MNKQIFVHALLNLRGWGSKKVSSFLKNCNYDYEYAVTKINDELNINQKDEFSKRLSDSERVIRNNLNKGISSICALDKEFPSKLYESTDSCVFLFYDGDISLLNKKSITIIGTRHPDDLFIEKGKIATNFFANKGYVIVSGLAMGCDTIAHKSSIDVGGKTIAVLPSPCDKPYPVANQSLAHEIVKHGGLIVSEYGTGEDINSYNFPKRDLIQSLLSNVILVIESSDSSGTMHAVRKHIKDKKKVFAIKGNDIDIIQDYICVDNIEELELVEKYII